MSARQLLPLEARDKLDDADWALRGMRGLSDLMCSADALECISPDNLNALISIVADRLETALDI